MLITALVGLAVLYLWKKDRQWRKTLQDTSQYPPVPHMKRAASEISEDKTKKPEIATDEAAEVAVEGTERPPIARGANKSTTSKSAPSRSKSSKSRSSQSPVKPKPTSSKKSSKSRARPSGDQGSSEG